MEIDLMKERRWIKLAAKDDAVRDQLPLSALDNVTEFRATLAKAWDPREHIPQVAAIDRVLGFLGMSDEQQENELTISATLEVARGDSIAGLFLRQVNVGWTAPRWAQACGSTAVHAPLMPG